MRKGKLSIDILLRIINIVYRYGKIKKTHLYMLSKLNYHSFSKYLSYLIEKRIIRIEYGNDCEYIVLTSNGEELIKLINELKKKLHWDI